MKKILCLLLVIISNPLVAMRAYPGSFWCQDCRRKIEIEKEAHRAEHINNDHKRCSVCSIRHKRCADARACESEHIPLRLNR